MTRGRFLAFQPALRTVLFAAIVSIAPLPSSDVRASTATSEPAAEHAVKWMLEQETAGIQGRAEIVIGQLDPRLVLAPCRKIEPFLPAGTRAWGPIRVGMRCRDGATWTAFLPVNVKVFGVALTARKALMFGVAPAENEVEPGESELSREPGTPVTDLRQVSGRVLARTLQPGQVLRLEYFRAAPAIAQGDQVRLLAKGPGFSISADGEALAHAQEGQSVRVKTETGRIVSGTARAGRVVELRF